MSNVTIAIPPFPSQDLAKLVLGYLAEEQLMTAYDEFLQASPYLDALRNEYDRIFMTSLKNILAEYRAVKIYVETCKPFILRKKLFQCTNLLEIVKFLVSNVDINKLHIQEGNAEKAGHSRHSYSKPSALCDLCTSLKLPNCSCRINQPTSHIEATSLEESVETTSLADLPGNISYNKKNVKESEPKNYVPHSITSSDQLKDASSTNEELKDASSTNEVQSVHNLSSSSDSSCSAHHVISSVTEQKCPTIPSLLIRNNELGMRNRVQGSNENLSLVSHNRSDNIYKSECKNAEKVKNVVVEEILKDFTTENGNSNNKITVPDSSTSENTVLPRTTTENDNNVTQSKNISKIITRPPPVLIKVTNDPKSVSLQPALHSLPRLAAKESLVATNESFFKPTHITQTKTEADISPKITILSDVKVDNDMKMPPLLKNAPSTALVQMQTMYINGTPAYKNTQQMDQAFTKDEIMAMPTIILVPTSDKTKKTVPMVTQNSNLNDSSATVSCSTNQCFEPLVIDVAPNEATSSGIDQAITGNSLMNNDKPKNEDGLVKTVDVVPVSHASLPKDNNLAGIKTSTPHVLPPTRKSSSTPRRTSHVRVLDFTTPRRILHETMIEQEGNLCLPSSSEVALSTEASTNPISKNISEDPLPKSSNNLCVESTCNVNDDPDDGATKENKTSIKLYNWDAQLRALAYIGNGNIEKSETIRTSNSKKCKKKSSRTHKNTSEDQSKCDSTKTSKSNDKKKRVSKAKKVAVDVEITDKNVDEVQEKASVSIVKPTINIISRKKWIEPVVAEKSQNKSNNSDGSIDTPELEKISLQNEIGAKLNISDLLETPYKQALYDIQMETPKFLGPDIPGDPLSDVKIMNIPTPRFLTTPKLTQNTPSSYSSHPTDYSSGGSYYKPDDQDYVLANEIMEEALTASVGTIATTKESRVSDVQIVTTNKACEGKSRPVRQCTKNVSYNYGTPSNSKMKDIDEKLEKSSTCSEASISKPDKKSKISTTDSNGVRRKREPKKKSKKCKTPIKKETPKAFMKIKPRRTTPVKEVVGKGKKKSCDLSHIMCVKPQPKKLVGGKDKNVNFSPVAVATVATKSRRKSSTPRKLNCTKKHNSENSTVNSPDRKNPISRSSANLITNTNTFSTPESDNEQQSLRWSDEGSQVSEPKMIEEKAHINESDDIMRIKEYIKTTLPSGGGGNNEGEGTLQVDLIKRGFDVETARMIERDLLETPTLNSSETSVQRVSHPMPFSIGHDHTNETESKKSDKSTESDCSTSNNLQIVQDDHDSDELDFTVYECNENTCNYFEYEYDEAKFVPSNQIKLKETFLMEICVEDDVEIRLRATSFNTVFEHDSKHDNVTNNDEEKRIEKPDSPVHYSSLYTPRKAQCYEIFDSTLTSLDTPLKPNTKAQEFETVTEIVLEVEKLETDIKLKPDSKKRKRVQSAASDDSSNGSKKVKANTSYLLNSAGIQNIDIESVLSKLHGP